MPLSGPRDDDPHDSEDWEASQFDAPSFDGDNTDTVSEVSTITIPSDDGKQDLPAEGSARQPTQSDTANDTPQVCVSDIADNIINTEYKVHKESTIHSAHYAGKNG